MASSYTVNPYRNPAVQLQDASGYADTIARAVIVTCPRCDADLAEGVMDAYARGRTYVAGTVCPECAGADKDPIDPEVAALRREAAKAKRQARRPRRQATA